MSEYDAKLATLIRGLTERSKSGSPTPAWDHVGGDTYELSLTKSTLRVFSRDNDGTHPFGFTILDDRGVPVANEYSQQTGEDPYNIASLHAAAARNHSQLDVKLDEILDELGFEEPPF